jgi:hypothetical protein
VTGIARLNNVKDLLLDVINNKIEGGYIGMWLIYPLYKYSALMLLTSVYVLYTETGVWRGGSSIFARAVLAASGETNRLSFVCDSFAGLPPGDWDSTPYLEVPSEVVASSFSQYGLLDSNVVFAKGFFNDTM